MCCSCCFESLKEREHSDPNWPGSSASMRKSTFIQCRNLSVTLGSKTRTDLHGLAAVKKSLTVDSKAYSEVNHFDFTGGSYRGKLFLGLQPN